MSWRNVSYGIVPETCPIVDKAFESLFRDVEWHMESLCAEDLAGDVRSALKQIRKDFNECLDKVKECTEALRAAHVKALDDKDSLEVRIERAMAELKD